MAKDDLHNMMGLDLYLSSLSDEEYSRIISQLKKDNRTNTPLVSWDIIALAHERQLELAARLKDLTAVKRMKRRFSWKLQTESLNLMNTEYEAVVVTDATQNIVWASPGFKGMTGYSVKHAVGQSPKFLQGENTSAETRAVIRKALKQGEPVKAALTNYRKNGEAYLCEVSIRPLFNKDNTLTHFIALEKEVA